MQVPSRDQGGLRRLLSGLTILAIVCLVGWVSIAHRRDINELRNEVQEMKSVLKQHEQVHQIEYENAELEKQIDANKRALESYVP